MIHGVRPASGLRCKRRAENRIPAVGFSSRGTAADVLGGVEAGDRLTVFGLARLSLCPC